MYLKFLLVPILFVFGQDSGCGSQTTCQDCIRQINCLWCITPKVKLQSNSSDGKVPIHCLPRNYDPTDITCDEVISPQSVQTIVRNDPFAEGVNPVQIQPQRMKLSLRKGDKVVLKMKYKQAENYPVDLYYLMDLSHSMVEHKKRLAQLGVKLAHKLQNLTNDVRLGFGSFIDKVELPFTSTSPSKLANPCKDCVPPYSYKNHLKLTTRYEDFQNSVQNAQVSGNLDSPEGGLDAIMQAIVCKEEIGWRPHARHLLVYSTDEEFHIAGDGKLAGVIEPNDAKCHMENNTYTGYLKYDYPSVSHINYVAKQNNINIIFAIVQRKKDTTRLLYQELSASIANSNFGELDIKNQENVIDLVVKNYNKIVQSVKLTHNASNDIAVSISPLCNNVKPDGCSDVKLGEIVSFDITIELRECPTGEATQKTIAIKPDALEEVLLIDIDVICDCPCSSKQHSTYEVNSKKCNGNGDLVCGKCKCANGRLGQNCECDSSIGSSEDTTNCIKDGSTEICSGLGDCKCGKCECFARTNPDEEIYGTFCECNNYSCKLGDNGLLCSDRGRCNCGNCTCHAGYTGIACDCPEGNSACIAPGTDQVCSGQGTCDCGHCACNKTHSGEYCERCTTCPAQRCEQFHHCVECQAYHEGIYNEIECKANCTLFSTIIVDKLDEESNSDAKKCRIQDKKGCIIIFEYIEAEKQLTVRAQKEKLCTDAPNVLAWIIGVISTILIAGLITLIIWKICTTVHDRREYAKFENERKALKWHRNDNPLYKEATTTFANPAYNRSSRISSK